MEHIKGEVVEVHIKRGDVSSISLTTGVVLKADLFIDCSGFKSLILGDALKTKFVSYKEVLINDRALAARVPSTPGHTDLYSEAHALPNGWTWEIPLWSKTGVGYVYSSKFQTEEEARRDFEEYLECTYGHTPLEIKSLKFKTGAHEVPWKSNCVAIGLSYGFVEPLESTGLWATCSQIDTLISLLVKNKGLIKNTVRSVYNSIISNQMQGIYSFVLAHYVGTSREDSPYWEFMNKNIEIDIKTLQILSTFSEEVYGWDRVLQGSPFPLKSWEAILLGLEVLGAPIDVEDLEAANRRLRVRMHKNSGLVENMETHYNYLKDNIYG